MASRAVLGVKLLSNNGVRQLLMLQQRNFSGASCLAVERRDTTEASQSSQHSEENDARSEQLKHDAYEQEDLDTRETILRAALPFVHQHGWTKKAIAAGAEAEGYPAVSHGMFPRGGAELVHFFYAHNNKQLASILADRVQQCGEEKPMTRKFITDALETRLGMIVPYIDTWPQAMSIMALPQNAVEALTNLANLVDEVWYYAGDRSVDFNWYTKRASLAAVYKSTEIYMLQDKSDQHRDTWNFLQRRVTDLQTFGSFIRNVPQMGTIGREGLVGLSILGRNLLGMNSRTR